MSGLIPVGAAYADESGQLYVGDMDGSEGVGALLDREDRQYLRSIPAGPLRRAARHDLKADALRAKANAPSVADVYQIASSQGLVQENQYNGIGSVSVALSSTGTLSDTFNRSIWAKSLVLDSPDGPGYLLVTAISIAGLPFNIGAKGTPLRMFNYDATRFGISFGRRMGLTGQTFSVSLSNIDNGGPHVATGGLVVDELNPWAQQKWMESTMINAALGGFGLGGACG